VIEPALFQLRTFDLSLRECNIIRYIAGYIVMKLKKFPLQSRFFDSIVISTCNFSISTVNEYSRLWADSFLLLLYTLWHLANNVKAFVNNMLMLSAAEVRVPTVWEYFSAVSVTALQSMSMFLA